MNCPKCQCPNLPGAVFCELCHEPFNRGAADNYLRSVRRQRHTESHAAQRRTTGGNFGVDRALEFLQQIDWKGIASRFVMLIKRYRTAFAGMVALSLLFLMIGLLNSPGVRYRYFRQQVGYALQAAPQRYLLGVQTDFKSWSERNRALDTPIAEFNQDEIGNVILETVRHTSEGSRLGLRAQEWIVIQRGRDRSVSRSVPLQDPTLAPLTVMLDPHGSLMPPPAVQTPRLGQAIDLVLPELPSKGIRIGDTWSSPTRWVESVGGWKFLWTGTLVWTLESAARCPEGSCAQLSYVGTVRPQLWAGPDWTRDVIGRPRFDDTTARGTALFDLAHERFISNTRHYATVLHVPINDLARIPIELRVGRGVRSSSGDLVVQLDHHINLHTN